MRKFEAMDKSEILKKAYMGEALPGFIHNMGNPLGALLGFVDILREEVISLRHDVENYTDEELRKAVLDSLVKISELFDFTARSELSLRKAMETIVLKCGKDSDQTVVDFELNELVRIESEVLMTNEFYKRRINKTFEYGAGPFPVKAHWSTFSQPIGSILFRYTIALTAVEAPQLSVRTVASRDRVNIEIRANTSLRTSDLVYTAAEQLPALTLRECREALVSFGTIEYAVVDAGHSAVTFDIALQDATHERERTLPGMGREATVTSRNSPPAENS